MFSCVQAKIIMYCCPIKPEKLPATTCCWIYCKHYWTHSPVLSSQVSVGRRTEHHVQKDNQKTSAADESNEPICASLKARIADSAAKISAARCIAG